MNDFYTPEQRELQDQFETRALADTHLQTIVHPEIQDAERGFIESRDMFFLATTGEHGQPSCSYKGGAPGLVKVVNARTVAFPNYDGNGMYLSLGNVRANAKVGMLFIDFETPHRLRLHGNASVDRDDPLIDLWPEAELVVRVAVSQLWINCPRYVHRYRKLASSRYVPQAACRTPLAEWKRIDLLQPVLPPRDQGRAEQEGGTITLDEYMAKTAAGEA